MAARGSDTIIWVSLGIIGVCGAFLVKTQLLAVRNATRVTKKEKTPELISQHTEDALKLDTLRELAFGANQDIRNAALKIIVERAGHGSIYQILLENVLSSDIAARDQALATVKYLSLGPAREATHSFATMKVIITYLGYVINSGTCILGQETNFKVRPTPEKDALYILYSAICNTSVREALRAGLVSRWLAKYPFGGPKSSESRKVEIVQSLRAGRSEDFMMRRILVAIDSDPEGRKQLRNYHLLGSVIGETPDDDEDGDILMIGGEDVAGHSNGRLRHRGSRIHEESLEEQALRRRRREAMVISDDGAPLSRDNIIQGQAYHE
ncbi:hypothetical protein MMC34_002941 [Xylographa carneopallida]|nr:hypothetical protein [Xylographa carneopallida]